MNNRTWSLVYVDILDGKPALCPKCGGNVEHSFFAGADDFGFGILKCTVCSDQFVLSRVKFPTDRTDVKAIHKRIDFVFFSEEEIEVLQKLEINPDVSTWNDEDYIRAEEKVGSEWTTEVMKSNSHSTAYGKIFKG